MSLLNAGSFFQFDDYQNFAKIGDDMNET